MIGELPARFTDVARLGEGSEGGTWVACDQDARGRRVVLKRVPAARSRQVRQAFEVLRRASSPHLPEALDLLPAGDGGLWLVTAWAPGRALSPGPIDGASAAREAMAVAHALRALHAVGTHHGDVSLANVIIGTEGQVALTDFGQIGCYGCGTPGFLAPEVLGGGGGPASDLFALGCVLAARLFGAPPWRDPAALAALPARGRAGVRARLGELGRALPGGGVDGRLLAVLEHLLDPDPAGRVGDLGALITRLGEIAGGDAGTAGGVSWWLPSHWPYRGVALEPVLAALAGSRRPRLIVVAGPPASGRGRAVEELVHRLVERDAASARLCAPERLPAALGRGGEPWLAAWMASDGTALIGAAEEASWPGELAGDPQDPRLARRRAAVLQAAAASARATLVIPGSVALAEQLAEADDPAILVLSLRPWSIDEVRGAIGLVLDAGGDEDMVMAWARALHDATGGWPARVIGTIGVCARGGIVRADVEALARLGADALPAIDPLRARELLAASWTGGGGEGLAMRGLHGSDGEPLPSALAAARRALGEAAVTSLARWRVGETQAAGRPIGLGLALDAGDGAAIDAWLAARGDASLADPALPRLLDRLEAQGSGPDGQVLSDMSRSTVVRHLLRGGEAGRALAIARGGQGSVALEILAARALEQLGRPADALALLDVRGAAGGASADDDASIRGLRWRALVDLGRAGEAHREALAWSGTVAAGGPAVAEALSWAALAAIYAGDEVRAAAWLAAAEAALGDRAASPGVRARIAQLVGNLAHGRGDLGAAEAAYLRAAELFAAAGERGGRAFLAASLAALAVESGAIAQGIASGRLALREFVARGQLQGLSGLVVNLVQLLLRIDAIDEARRLHRLLGEVGEGALAAGRLARVAAEIARAELLRSGERRGASLVERRFAGAAEALEAASAAREAVDAWLQASVLARHERRLDAAAAALERAERLIAERPGEVDDALGVVSESLAVAAVRGDEERLRAAAEALGGLPGAELLRARGRLERAWTCDRTLLEALHAAGGAPPDTLRGLVRRLRETMESIMDKVDRLDRAAVRASLTRELDPALGELVADLTAAEPGAGERAGDRGREPAAATARLIQIYRRLSREDRVEALVGQIVDAIMEICDAERGVGVLLPWREGQARIEVVRDLAVAGGGATFSRSIIERVLAEGEPILSVDAATDDRFDSARSVSHLALRSVLAVPFLCRGELLGAAYVDHRLRRGAFDEAALAAAEALAELAAFALAHARALAVQREQGEALRQQGRDLARLLEERELEVRGLREQVRQGPERAVYRGMVGTSPAMQATFRLIDRVADSDVPVVIYGESGTGKELVARAIHDAGPRRSQPFVAENCGAIPESLLETVLFGHAKGAFTGAHKASAGLFEAAHGGTIFLDEVGEMSPAMQTKLLRVLQEGEVRRVGDTGARRVDVRVIAASNRNLEQMVADGRFRGDLYYRIQVVRIALPPLRERPEDLQPLLEHFLRRYDRERRLSVSGAAMRLLARYPWPGNVRELENEVQRLAVLVESRVEPEDLSPQIRSHGAAAGPAADDLRLRPRLDQLERDLIARALERAEGNQTRAAEILGLSRFGLQKKLRRLAEGGAADDEADDEAEPERRPAPGVRKRR